MKYECSAKYEVENNKKYSIVEKTDLIPKKDMEHKEIMREKENLKIGSSQYEREFWKGNEVNIELRLNVDEQQDDKIFKVNQT